MAYGVNCEHCGANFALPDDLFERKVKGRVVTIRCKRCQRDISVNGVELASSPHSDRPEAVDEESIDSGPEEGGTPTVPLASIPPAKVLWVVSFAADDDRELTAPQIKRALERGEIDGDSIAWKEGMEDWLPIAEIPPLAKLLPTGSAAASAKVETGGFLGTGMQVRGADAALKAALDKAKKKRPTLAPPPSSPRAPKPGDAGERARTPPAEVADPELGEFKSVSAGTLEVDEQAPPSSEALSINDSEVEVVESEAAPAVAGDASPKPPPARPQPKPKQLRQAEPEEEDEEPPPSGTPDLRSLTTSLERPTGAKPKQDERADDELLSLGLGSITGPALAPPTIDLSALPEPEPEPESSPSSAPASKRSGKPKKTKSAGKSLSPAKPGKRPRDSEQAGATSRSMPAQQPKEDESPGSSITLWLVLGAAAVIAGIWWFSRPTTPSSTASTAEPQPTAPSTAATVEPTVESVAPESPTEPSASAEPTAVSTAEPTAPPPKVTDTAPAKTQALSEPPLKATAEPKPTTKPTADPPPATTVAPVEPKEAPIAGPFDRAAALSALTSAAGAASACRQEGDPSGTAAVIVTFAPSGRVTSATVNGPPFAGTKTGGCIASTMRRAKIPPFSGDAVTVSRTVVIQ